MITWKDILKSLNMVDSVRLDDPATMLSNDELIPIDIIEIEVDEIGDNRLVAIAQEDINK